VADAADGCGIHARILPPSRWQKMGASKRQKAIRAGLIKKLSEMTHIPQNTLREEFFTPISLLVEQDPAKYVREFQLDADELNLFIHDKARSAQVLKEIAREEKAKEKKSTKEPKTSRKKDDPPDKPEEKRQDRPSGQATLF
jgi:replication factor C large subunit